MINRNKKGDEIEMGTLYLHIGTYKTGTSAIQEFCGANREILEKSGFFFPLFKKYEMARYERNAHFLCECVEEAKRAKCSLVQTDCWRYYMNAIRDIFLQFNSILLTDEELWDIFADKNNHICEELKHEGINSGFNIKIIVYLRRQDQYFLSLYSQMNKGFNYKYAGLEWETIMKIFIEERRYDYYSNLEHMMEIFGKENINVRIYERRHFNNGDVIDDFMNALGLQLNDDFVRPEGDVNSSISRNATEIKRIINTLPGVIEKRPWILAKAAIDSSVPIGAQQKWSMFTQQELDEFLALCEPSNRRIAQEYLGSAEPLFSPPGPLPPHWTPDNPDMYASIVRYFGAVVFEQQREIEKLREDVTSKFFLKKKLRTLLRKFRSGFKK